MKTKRTFERACKTAYLLALRDGRPRYVVSIIPNHYHVQVKMPKVSFLVVGNVGFGYGFWSNRAVSVTSYFGFPANTAKHLGSSIVLGGTACN